MLVGSIEGIDDSLCLLEIGFRLPGVLLETFPFDKVVVPTLRHELGAEAGLSFGVDSGYLVCLGARVLRRGSAGLEVAHHIL